MKIKSEHYEYLDTQIARLLDAHGRKKVIDAYETGNFLNSDRVQDLQKRFCFDLLYAIPDGSRWVCDNLYSYMNDDNIYTALKKICPKVERRF